MTAPSLLLTITAPSGEVLRTDVRSMTAEDESGRFGIRPKAAPMVAALIPSLLTARDVDGEEVFIAVGPGLLYSDRDHVDIAVRHAIRCESLERVADTLEEVSRRADAGETAMRSTLKGLLDKVALTLARGERSR